MLRGATEHVLATDQIVKCGYRERETGGKGKTEAGAEKGHALEVFLQVLVAVDRDLALEVS